MVLESIKQIKIWKLPFHLKKQNFKTFVSNFFLKSMRLGGLQRRSMTIELS